MGNRKSLKVTSKIALSLFLCSFSVGILCYFSFGFSFGFMLGHTSAPLPAEIQYEARAGLIEYVEDQMKPVINYFKIILTKHEMSTMARSITVKAIGKGIVPTPANFRQYIRDSMQSSRDPSLDQWNTPYAFERKGKQGLIVCLGPDKKRGTPDDIVYQVTLP